MRYGLKLPEYFKEYEDGKHRRYGLLFSVNGGAFAIINVMMEKCSPIVVGGLSLMHISLGMVFFTIVMVADIYIFGQNLRSTLACDPRDPSCETTELFGLLGKIVLVGIGVLICLGWVFVMQ